MKKIIFIVIDGLGDAPLPELGGKTPLQAAKTPNLDYLAEKGICGLVKPVYQGAIPTSEEGHFALFGYNPFTYKIKRGIFTALGAGIKVKSDDVAVRGNFAKINKKGEILDRRAGRIKRTEHLIKLLNGLKIKGVRFLVKGAGEHRLAIVARGKDLSPNISDGDPHYSKLNTNKAQKIIPLDKDPKSSFTAEVFNEFLDKSKEILEKHSRRTNYILIRGASSLIKLPSFKEKYGLKAACIAGKLLYKQIGIFLGMDLIKVKGATGLANTNLKGKFEAAKKAIKKYDFVFLHIKAADTFAHDGKFLEKTRFLQKVDKSLKSLFSLREVVIVITGDHSTCSNLKRHCQNPVPLLVSGIEERDRTKKFSERSCLKGGLGTISQLDVLSKVLKMLY